MKFIREPLVHFLVLGAVIFLISGLLRNPKADKPDRIVVTAGHVEQIIEGWSRTWQRPPAPQELEGLIEDYIKEELFYRVRHWFLGLTGTIPSFAAGYDRR